MQSIKEASVRSVEALAHGVRHRWLEVHAIEYVVGHCTELSRACYQHHRAVAASLFGPPDV